MHNNPTRLKLPLLAGAACALALASTAQLRADAYTGRAFAAYVKDGGAPQYFADTGGLQAAGGWAAADVLAASSPELSAEVLNSASSAAMYVDGPQVVSNSSLANLDLASGAPYALTADYVEARAETGASLIRAASRIEHLSFGGRAVTVTGEPNQTVAIAGIGTLVINEQDVKGGRGKWKVLVNALHLYTAGGAEFIVASAYSAINP